MSARVKFSSAITRLKSGTQRERGKIPQRWKRTQMINVGNQMDILGFIKLDSVGLSELICYLSGHI